MHTALVTAHELCLNDQDQIVHADGTAFDAETYSRMKYGDRAATRGFGYELANQIAEEAPEAVFSDTPPSFLVAYKAVPPACYYLSRYCIGRLNVQRVSEGLEPGRVLQIYKGAVMATNYAGASPEDRQRELESIDFSLEGRSLRGQPAAVLDDVRITGGAERRILEVIAPESPAILLLGYTAIFNADQAKSRPSVENDLNTTTIRQAADLLPAIQQDNFDLNIRTLKLLLATPADGLRVFLQHAPTSLIEDMLRGTVDTGPDFIRQYRDGYNTLAQAALERGL